jgi:antirestriction protein ArdC
MKVCYYPNIITKDNGMAKQKYEKKDHRLQMVEKIIESWDDNTVYTKPWIMTGDRPYNPETGTQIRGVNLLSFMLNNYDDPRYYTFNGLTAVRERLGLEIKDLHIEKGSEGFPIFKAVEVILNKEKWQKDRESGLIVPSHDETGNEKPAKIMTMAYCGTGFSVEQIHGSEHLPRHVHREVNPIPELEKVMEAMKRDGLTYKFLDIDQAYYRPDTDTVCCPHPDRFKSDMLMARTVLHETGHATGHAKRLNRESMKNYTESVEVRAEEELVAEFSSYFMGIDTGIGYDRTKHDNHSAYTRIWAERLGDDKHALFRAVGRAEKASKYVAGKVLELEKELGLNKDKTQGIERTEAKILLPDGVDNIARLKFPDRKQHSVEMSM